MDSVLDGVDDVADELNVLKEQLAVKLIKKYY